MNGIKNYLAWKEASEAPPRYVITGMDARGKRFKPIRTSTPTCYNIYRGTVWEEIDGRRKVLYRIWN